MWTSSGMMVLEDDMRKKNKGLTLLEVMIALFIFSLMVASVFPVFLTSRMTGLAANAFSQARQLAQSEVERLVGYSQTLSYNDSLYQIITQDGYSCVGFSWTTDLVTGDILYAMPANPVTCVKTSTNYRIDLSLRQDATVNDPAFKDILIQVTSINITPELKRYETLYATKFKS